ncbi:APG6-domain-containing protein [Suillus fuscotomentosus]|uniref:APG6-domain-containing protein n=1 Tax=Suillus fuscotomentosus TaxID=1912939 RepID=A0AAD4EDS7_9AGAM|nr:APG6-domain-containing protein [Suillus fuscotomentosus]KAG1904280.1 APG6-domain-containing protein [Suillus fuscotomentosus]
MSYVCQQCKEPLQLDASLVDLAPSAYDMIVASLPSVPASRARYATDSEAEKIAQLPSPSASKAAWQQATPSDNSRASPPLSTRAQGKQPQRNFPAPNESFVLLQESMIRSIPSPIPGAAMPKKATLGNQKNFPAKNTHPLPAHQQPEPDHSNPTPISHHLRSTMRLFNVLSTRSDIDHPLCAECTQILLSSLQRQLDETKKERDGYIAFEKEVRKERERESLDLSRQDAEKKIERLKSEERAAVEQLRLADREREQLDEELKLLETEEKALEEEEAEFWRSHNEHLLVLAEQASRLASLRAAYAADYATLEKLERTNVYNDAFCIGHDGVFGTINGLRLGRVPGVPVEWPEINAAWGQTLLLLYTIARKLDYTFENYRLIPMGSFSRIERTVGDKATYELYGSGDLHLGRLLHNRRFDFAMVAFLECLKQLIDSVKSQDPTIEFPHQIVKDKIGEASVKLQFSQEEAWTRALRHVLLALKIVLKWTTNGGNG